MNPRYQSLHTSPNHLEIRTGIVRARIERSRGFCRRWLAFAALAVFTVAAAGCESSSASAELDSVENVGMQPIATPLDSMSSDAPLPTSMAPRDVSVDTSRRRPNSTDRIAALFDHFPPSALDQQRWDTTGGEAWVESTLASMSLRRKLAQLVIVRLELGRDDVTPRQADTRSVVEHGVGGFIISRLIPPERVAEEVRRLQSLSDTPLFFSADYERGVGRFANNFTELPSNMAIGATGDSIAAMAAGMVTAIESRAIGVNLLFAPVADVNNNPANPIINIRSYGDDPMQVARLAAAYIRGAESHGVLTTAKHFPGHGNSSVDTHSRMDVVAGTLEELQKMELLPFEKILHSDHAPAAVMMAHLGVSAFDKSAIPATLSASVTGYLRQLFGHNGLIITDDVRMGALQNEYSLTERVVGPVLAGADIILTPESLPQAIDALADAVLAGRLSESRIDKSVRRVLRAKAQLGLHVNAQPDFKLVEELAAHPYGQVIADTIALESLTVVKDTAVSVLPGDVTLIQLSNFSGSESIDRAMTQLATALEVAPENELRLSTAPSAAITDWVRAQTSEGPVVLALHLRLRSGRGTAGLGDGHQKIVDAVFDLDRPTIGVVFGNPYVAANLEKADRIIVGYDQTIATVDAAAEVISNRDLGSGSLPVTIRQP